PPFRGETPLDTLEQVRSQEPVPPRRLRPRLPRDLDTICLQCLQKEPARRYASAHDLADDLRRFLAGEPVLARPVGALGRLAKWVRRRPAVAALLVLSLAGSGAFGGALIHFRLAVDAARVAEANTRAEEAQKRERLARANLEQVEDYRAEDLMVHVG